jgi:zinc protease
MNGVPRAPLGRLGQSRRPAARPVAVGATLTLIARPCTSASERRSRQSRIAGAARDTIQCLPTTCRLRSRRPAISRHHRLAAMVLALVLVEAKGHGSTIRVMHEGAVRRVVLPNGLKIVLAPDRQAPLVGMALQYQVGSRDDPDKRPGLALLAKMLMLRATKHTGEGEYDRRLEAAGCVDSRSSTTFDQTKFELTVPAEEIALPLWLWSDQMGFAVDRIDQRLIDQQLSTVRNQRTQQYENRAAGRVSEIALGALYPPGHPYHRAVVSGTDELAGILPDEVRTFILTHYTPDRATLVVTGDFDPAHALSLVIKYFGSLRRQGALALRPPAAAPSLAREVRIELGARVELPSVTLAWATPASYAPGDADLDLVGELLAGGQAGWLRWRLVTQLGIATEVSAHQSSRDLGSEFSITAQAAPGHTARELIAGIDEVVAKLQGRTPDPLSYGAAVSGRLMNKLFATEKTDTRAAIYADCEARGVYSGCLSASMSRFSTVSANALSEVASRYLPRDRRVVVEVAPSPDAPIAGEIRSANGEK